MVAEAEGGPLTDSAWTTAVGEEIRGHCSLVDWKSEDPNLAWQLLEGWLLGVQRPSLPCRAQGIFAEAMLAEVCAIAHHV